jgi:hypothetical protein
MGRHSDSSDSERDRRRKKEKKHSRKATRRSPSPGAGKVGSKLTDASNILDAALAAMDAQAKAQEPAVIAAPSLAPPTAQLVPPGEASATAESDARLRVYIGNINYAATENDVRVAFGRFGPIRSVTMRVDPEKGHHRGFAFLEYVDASSVAALMRMPKGAISFGGMPVRIDRPTVPGSGPLPGPSGDNGLSAAPQAPTSLPGDFRPIDVSVSHQAPGGSQRTSLAQQMAAARGLRPASDAGPGLALPGLVAPPTVDGATAIIISGMVKNSGEVNDELVEDVRQECSRFGRVLDMHFFQTDPKEGPHVAVEFAALDAARACASKMNGRLFDGRPLRSSILSREYYQQIKRG